MRLRPPKLAALMGGAEEDVLTHMTFPARHRTKVHGTNHVERMNAETKRRADALGILPNEAAITRLVATIPMEPFEEWAVLRSRCTILGTQAPNGQDTPVSLGAAQAVRPARPCRSS